MVTDLTNIDHFFDGTPVEEYFLCNTQIDEVVKLTLEEVAKCRITQVPLDIRQLVTSMGINIKTCNGLFRDYVGLLEQVGLGWVIYLNESGYSEQSKRYTLAHELGHVLLHRDTVGLDFCPDEMFHGYTYFKWADYGSRYVIREHRLKQHQADMFAMRLLMPEHIIEEKVKSGGCTIGSLADEFKLSTTVVKCRMQEWEYIH
jgi:hypothetical protein